MFIKEDNTYNEIRKRSFEQWLSELENHSDIAVRDGVRLARDYVQYLEKENQKLQDENALKNRFLKQMKERLREQ